MTFAGKTYWIVGASEGLGRALAQGLSAQGAHLILSARNQGRLVQLAGELGHARPLALDVTNRESVVNAAHSLRAGAPLDGVIYCAGAYDPMRAQDWDASAAEHVADINYMGALRVLSQVVPDMARRQGGHIVLIGSLAGFRGLPGAIGYGSSKAAIMHLAENLRADLHQTGVVVQCLNPGFIRTRLTDKNRFDMPMLMTPEDAAARCLRTMATRRFSVSFPAPFAWLFTLGRFLPLSWFQTLLRPKT